MPTDKPRVTFTVSQDTLDKIDDYRFRNKSKNQTQAILSLIEKGLSDMKKKIPPILMNQNQREQKNGLLNYLCVQGISLKGRKRV